ncbi:MAG TPA: hypothetical protein VF482_22675, partial [Trebonia sp.]
MPSSTVTDWPPGLTEICVPTDSRPTTVTVTWALWPAASDPEDGSATVLDALPVRGGSGPATIATRAGLDIATVLRCLGELAAGGFAERCERGWRVRRA